MDNFGSHTTLMVTIKYLIPQLRITKWMINSIAIVLLIVQYYDVVTTAEYCILVAHQLTNRCQLLIIP
jgi:hypothetical protein